MTGRVARALAGLVAVTLLALGITGVLAEPSRVRALLGLAAGTASDWSVVMCDVGQGDMTVVRTGTDSALVVDAGPDVEAADRCLRALGVHRVSLLVLTHFHADHVLGVPGVLRGRVVDAVLTSRYPQPSANAALVHRWLMASGVTAAAASVGQRGRLGPSAGWQVGWQVLAADVPDVAAADGAGSAGSLSTSGSSVAAGSDDGAVVNDTSVVLEITVVHGGGCCT